MRCMKYILLFFLLCDAIIGFAQYEHGKDKEFTLSVRPDSTLRFSDNENRAFRDAMQEAVGYQDKLFAFISGYDFRILTKLFISNNGSLDSVCVKYLNDMPDEKLEEEVAKYFNGVGIITLQSYAPMEEQTIVYLMLSANQERLRFYLRGYLRASEED